MRLIRNRFIALSILLLISGTFLEASESKEKKRARRANSPVQITVKPWGPSEEMRKAAIKRAEMSEAVQALLKGRKYSYISLTYVDAEDKALGAQSPTRYRAEFYDYTNDRTIVAEGDFAGRTPITASQNSSKPIPSDEEFDTAVNYVKNTAAFKTALASGSLKAFQPMPLLTTPDGSNRRLINVGLDGTEREIVSVDMNSGEVIRYERKAPPTAMASPESCGPVGWPVSPADAGQYQLTISRNGSPLWEMLVTSPQLSYGSQGSGIEVRDVKFKGKMVLKRGHVPILNVEYVNNACGPFRDNQNQLHSFMAPAAGATNPLPGFRILAPGQVATTIVENGDDIGDYTGIAIYTQDVGLGSETVMVTEMRAGWYRYIMEWRFADDGTIRPRFGFGAVNNTCVCHVHNHHAYWRLDFDVVNSANKVFQMERGRRFQTPVLSEMRTNKNLATRRSILIQNSLGDEAYQLTPNVTDGVVDSFAVNDLWLLRYHGGSGFPVQGEIDDGFCCLKGQIQINPWVNGESLLDEDVVVWYGAHYLHADGQDNFNPDRTGQRVISGSHVVGPDIRPVRW